MLVNITVKPNISITSDIVVVLSPLHELWSILCQTAALGGDEHQLIRPLINPSQPSFLICRAPWRREQLDCWVLSVVLSVSQSRSGSHQSQLDSPAGNISPSLTLCLSVCTTLQFSFLSHSYSYSSCRIYWTEEYICTESLMSNSKSFPRQVSGYQGFVLIWNWLTDIQSKPRTGVRNHNCVVPWSCWY